MPFAQRRHPRHGTERSRNIPADFISEGWTRLGLFYSLSISTLLFQQNATAIHLLGPGVDRRQEGVEVAWQRAGPEFPVDNFV